MDLVKTLIAKAAEKLGSQAALARELGVHRSQITNWKSGTDKCQAADLAAIAYLAGFNAMNVLAATTLKEHEGTQKGAVLNAALGVHCRIGSSETGNLPPAPYAVVHCRIGSSENVLAAWLAVGCVHCRIGSSEIHVVAPVGNVAGSLPNRQLRNLLAPLAVP